MNADLSATNRIQIISEPGEIKMADEWFDVATSDHFWIRKRFEVIKRILGTHLDPKFSIAEIGCGHGLLQRQMEDYYGVAVDGFDLNLPALKRNVSRSGNLFFYNISERQPRFSEKYKLLLLLDVLEHVEQECEFLSAVRDMISAGGKILIGVPALQSLYSDYDTAVGHLRRYSIETLSSVIKKCRFEIEIRSYWGFSMLPLLWLRKFYLKRVPPEETINGGFGPRNEVINWLLRMATRVEVVPQSLCGTSVMILARKASS